MDNGKPTPDGGALLRTLAPALRQLGRGLRAWLDGPHAYPLSTLTRATLEGVVTDLYRQSEALDVDRPLLVVMLMGGTGVGKSTLLNALAGGRIAQASFTRPTTRDPIVYYHETVRTDRLDPALRHCRLVPHDRPALEQKVLVDTPDLDSNDLSNREKLVRLLPVADIVLYVGSQEKYHDKLGWELFLEQRRRRAFAFVLNKWDRCQHAGADGARPDDDLLKDLEHEGFRSPLLFRTCAQHWLERAVGESNGAPQPPDGEQFLDLVHWLEMGLTRLEIEAIKARGVSQMLRQLDEALEAACPPDLTEVADRTRAAWEGSFDEEAEAEGEVLLNTLEPYQREIEHHFTVEGQRRFRGLMAAYLNLFTRARYVGTSLRDRVPFLPRPEAPVAPTTWDLGTFTRSCSELAASRHLDGRVRALANRLLVEADERGFPVSLLNEPLEAATRIDWRGRYAQALVEVLHEVEQQWSRPTGARRWVQTGLVLMADWLPPLSLLAALIVLLALLDPMSRGYQVQLADALLPPVVTLVVLVIMHLLIALLLPLRWPAIRGEFRKRLERQLRAELVSAYGPVPADVAGSLREERRRVEKLRADTREVAAWLEQREQDASIAGLYGA